MKKLYTRCGNVDVLDFSQEDEIDGTQTIIVVCRLCGLQVTVNPKDGAYKMPHHFEKVNRVYSATNKLEHIYF